MQKYLEYMAESDASNKMFIFNVTGYICTLAMLDASMTTTVFCLQEHGDTMLSVTYKTYTMAH